VAQRRRQRAPLVEAKDFVEPLELEPRVTEVGAVGVGEARPECMTVAEVGITSEEFAYSYRGAPDAMRVIVSLGSNDKGDSSEALWHLRRSIHGRAKSVLKLLHAIESDRGGKTCE